MRPGVTLLGLVGVISLSISGYYTFIILRHLWKREETSLARIFVGEQVHQAFLVLTVGAFIFSNAMAIAAAGTILGGRYQILTKVPIGGAMIAVLTFFYFTRTLAGSLAAESDDIDL